MNRNELSKISKQLFNCFWLIDELAKTRDSFLVTGFIAKAEEECSFNDFYSNGNEDIIKYAGILQGLEKSKPEIFTYISDEYMNSLKRVYVLAKELINNNEEYKVLYNHYYVGAEFCLYAYVEENLKYENINKYDELYALAEKLDNIIVNDININKNFEIQYFLESCEKVIREVNQLYKSVRTLKSIKRNAFCSVRKFDWLYEKGTFENKNSIEVENYYRSHLQKEKKARDYILKYNHKDSFVKKEINSRKRVSI